MGVNKKIDFFCHLIYYQCIDKADTTLRKKVNEKTGPLINTNKMEVMKISNRQANPIQLEIENVKETDSPK